MPTRIPRQRRKPSDKLHDQDLKVWLTDSQKTRLKALADQRDMAQSVLARQAMMLGLEIYLASIEQQQDKAA